MRFGIREIGFIIWAYYFSKIDSVYQLRSMNYFQLDGLIKAIMHKRNLGF